METLKRIAVALIFIPVFIFCVFNSWLNGIFLFSLLIIISVIGSFEVYKIYKAKNIKINLILVIIVLLLSWAGEYLRNFYPLLTEDYRLWIIILFFIALSVGEIFTKDFSNSLERISGSVLIFIYLGILLPFTYKLKMISPNGAYILAFLVTVTWSCDTFAYFTGKYLGKHKLNLAVSPNKTLEGFAGGFIFSLGFGFLFRHIFRQNLKMTLFELKYFIPVLIIIIVFTFLGDMIESIFKRSAQVKDSQKVIPGHGGILDAFDSTIVTSTVLYFILLFTT